VTWKQFYGTSFCDYTGDCHYLHPELTNNTGGIATFFLFCGFFSLLLLLPFFSNATLLLLFFFWFAVVFFLICCCFFFDLLSVCCLSAVCLLSVCCLSAATLLLCLTIFPGLFDYFPWALVKPGGFTREMRLGSGGIILQRSSSSGRHSTLSGLALSGIPLRTSKKFSWPNISSWMAWSLSGRWGPRLRGPAGIRCLGIRTTHEDAPGWSRGYPSSPWSGAALLSQ